jgi:hypothetical protein
MISMQIIKISNLKFESFCLLWRLKADILQQFFKNSTYCKTRIILRFFHIKPRRSTCYLRLLKIPFARLDAFYGVFTWKLFLRQFLSFLKNFENWLNIFPPNPEYI